MFADLFIAVPTIPVMSLSGYFLGVLWGGTASSIGLILAGVVGYWLSSKYGDRLMKRILKNEKERMEAILTYQEHGAVVILLSRAVPMLPEISACMAGMTKMPFGKFLILWLSSIIPCSFVAAYAGSVSSVEDPRPAILTAVGISVSYWLAWFIFTRLKKKKGLSASSSSD